MTKARPNWEDYATIESYGDGVLVYSLGSICFSLISAVGIFCLEQSPPTVSFYRWPPEKGLQNIGK